MTKEKNNKEYQTVVLAALLHDVGKFWERTEDEEKLNEAKKFSQGKYSHSWWSALFVHKFSYLFSEPDFLLQLVQFHHNPQYKFQKIISIADKLSSTEREIAEDKEGGKGKSCTPLVSIFSKITLDKPSPPKRYHSLKPLKLDRCIFPKTNVEISSKDYQNLWNRFESELCRISQDDLFSLYHLLQKYTWCIPSTTRKKEEPDISLFDHLKTTATIAACLFKEEIEEDSLNMLDEALRKTLYDENLLLSEEQEFKKKRFILLGADVSEIQDFLYSISEPESAPGVAQRLRGRSFYLSIMNEVFARYILKATELEITNLLYCGGGNFQILLPLNERERAEKAVSEIQDWLFDEFHGNIGLIVEQIPFAAEEFLNYGKLLTNLWNRIENAKKKKFLSKIQQDIDQLLFPKDKEEEKLKSKGKRIDTCKSCNKNVVDADLPTEEKVCYLCKSHQNDIGERLPKANIKYVVFGDKPLPIEFGDIGCANLIEHSQIESYQINCTDNFVQNEKSGFKFIAKRIPIAIEEFKMEIATEIKIYIKNQVLDFGAIAEMSTGDKRLGVLQMDIDRLGLIFAIGLEKEDKDNKSISRIATLSRMLEFFFEGYINNICDEVFQDWKEKSLFENKDKITNIFYIVYSGGDDLFIIGPWNEIIKLSLRINEEFREYTCQNDNITISAGIFLCKPKFPVKRFAPLTGEILEESKNAGRNRNSLFGEIISWERENDQLNFKELLEFGENLYRAVAVEDKENQLNRGFLHQLIRMRNQYLTEERIDLNFIPALVYQITRNVKQKAEIEEGGERKKLKEFLKEKLITDCDGYQYFKNIRVPASYALLKSKRR